jgi:HlyD family secretion protein
MNKKWWIIGIVVALLVALGVGGWQRISAQETEAGAQVEETAVVQQGTLSATVSGTGSLAPKSQVALAFLVGGRVTGVLVEEGQTVEAGQALVRLETDELALQVARAEAALAAAEGQLAQLLAPPQAQEVVAAEADVEAMLGQVDGAIANLDLVSAAPDSAQIAAAQAEIAAAEMAYRTALHTYDTTDEDDEERKEQAHYDLWAAEVALEAARTRLDDLWAGADAEEVRAALASVSTAEAQRDAAQAQLDLLLAGATEKQIQIAQAAVEQARVGLDQARLALARATLGAPMAGTITSLDVELGERVAPGDPIVVLSDVTGLEVDINLDETDVPAVAVGQTARSTLDAFPDVELPGTVTYVAPVAQNQSGVVLYLVTVRLASDEGSTGAAADPAKAPVADVEQASGQRVNLRPGMTAEVEITTNSQEDTLIVPLRAIETEAGRAYVWRLNDGEFERTEVTLGLMTDTEVEVTRGLAEGDVVSVTPGPTGKRAQTQLPGLIGVLHGQGGE